MSTTTDAGRQPFDQGVLAATAGLATIGVIMVSSASVAIGDRFAGEPLYYLYQHLGAIGLGLACLFGAAAIPLRFWHRANWLVLFVALALLVAVLLPGLGREVNGSVRWIEFGAVSLQASEPARLLLIMYLASYAVRHNIALTSSLTGFLKPMAIIGIAAVLLLLEPDYGAVVVLTATSLGVLFAAGARLRDLGVVAFAAVVLLGFVALMESYRVARIMSFRAPFDDPYNDGFQLVQSLIAIGSGDLFGVGIGESVQKLFYLPEAHTDFIFAVLAEELGLVGSTAVIVLFGLLVWRALLIGRRALDNGMPFHGLLCTGIGITLALQAGINIGVNTGLLPTKGLTLPLISYGRTSTVVTLAAIGLLLRAGLELSRAPGGQASPPPARQPRRRAGRLRGAAR